MATECRRKKTKINRVKLARIQVGALFLFLVLVGVVIGLIISKATLKPKIETQTVYETVEVPAYQPDSLPEDVEVQYFDVPLSHNLQKYIYEICADEQVPVTLVMAIIEHESSFNPEAVSDTDDYGLMQINVCNHDVLEQQYRTADMLNPYQNVFCGVKILASYLNEYEGDYNNALMAYNMGEYGAKKAWKNDIKSSSYSCEILGLWEKYEEVSSNATNVIDE